MRVAIVGAGLAGLSCAHELERLGVVADLFERLPAVGERFTVVETMAQFMHANPLEDIMRHLRQDLFLPVNPVAPIQRVVLHSARHEATINGKLGYITIRGRDERSLEKQLARHIVSPIHFNADPDPRELAREYDWVVLATGGSDWGRVLGRWTEDISWWVRGAIVKGDFNPGELHFFFNTRYAKTGYAMIAPLDERHASVGVGVPHSTTSEAELFWQTFRAEMRRRFWGEEESSFAVNGISCGSVQSCVIGNILLIGNDGGFIEGLAIAGQCPSMESGVMAARQIVMGDRSLSRYARRWRTYYQRGMRLRRNVNAWTNTEMDQMVLAVRWSGGVLARSPWNLIRPGGMMLDAMMAWDDANPEPGRQ